ncbi:MAG: redoxin domain-containing protein [Actinomycetia bacterium]|nr:redoxin domain-containing protein [Actinomycetes bacterium]
MREDIVPGSKFPDYKLRDHKNKPHMLSELQGDDPMILTLLRGHYCPKDRQQLQELVGFHAHMDVGYARIVTITCDDILQLNELKLGVGAHWTFLHDPERTIQKDLDIKEYTDPLNDVMIPHTIVLEPGLVIYKIYNGYWYWGRPTPDELHRDLRDISSRIRPDWKIDTPEMRAAWDRGERDMFWPYGLSMREIIERSE